mmetsp:Transcript_36990/g.78498  ORF Transcript_36990/g.78498 Transcript_36990/m.78498 type:complete len:142 (-) Transcript_36990:407-832(-)
MAPHASPALASNRGDGWGAVSAALTSSRSNCTSMVHGHTGSTLRALPGGGSPLWLAEGAASQTGRLLAQDEAPPNASAALASNRGYGWGTVSAALTSTGVYGWGAVSTALARMTAPPIPRALAVWLSRSVLTAAQSWWMRE